MAEIKENTTEKKGLKLKGLFNYEWILKNTNFFLFLSMLAVLYIANGHYADKTLRNIAKSQNDLKQLQYEYKTIKAEVMQKSREPEIIKLSEQYGLKQNNEPPQRIVLEVTQK